MKKSFLIAKWLRELWLRRLKPKWVNLGENVKVSFSQTDSYSSRLNTFLILFLVSLDIGRGEVSSKNMFGNTATTQRSDKNSFLSGKAFSIKGSNSHGGNNQEGISEADQMSPLMDEDDLDTGLDLSLCIILNLDRY